MTLSSVTLAVIVGQVGCLTLVIIIAAVLGGLWLDRTLNTRPWFTLAFVLGSIPISLLVMLFVSRAAVRRIKTQVEQSNTDNREGTDLGKNS